MDSDQRNLPGERTPANAALRDLIEYPRSDRWEVLERQAAATGNSEVLVLSRLDEIKELAPYLLAALQNEADIHPGTFAQVAAKCDAILEGLDQLRSENPNDPERIVERSGSIVAPISDIRQNLFPVTHPGPQTPARIAGLLTALERAEATVEETLREARHALEAARSAAERQAATGLVADFGRKAAQHRGASKRWLVVTAIAGFAFFGTAITLLGLIDVDWVHLPDYSASTETGALVAASSLKLAVLGSVGYFVFFSSRNYRVNRHLQTAYELRASIVTTAQALAAAAASDDERSSIVVAMVSSVFPVGDTGFVSSDSTADVGLLTSLLASQAKGVVRP